MLAAAVVVGIGLIVAFVGSSSARPLLGTEIRHGLRVAPASFNGSVRALTPRARRATRVFPAPRAERELDPTLGPKYPLPGAATLREAPLVASAPAPDPSISFKGLDFLGWGAGWPPDTVGDVGPTHFVQAVNTSVGIFRKSDGVRLAAFTFDDFWSGTGTACDASNQGDPTAVYDPQGDRWIVADFAFTGDGSVGPYYECIAVSKTSDPVSGGWWLYAIRADDASHPWFPDYPKMGIWPDGLYMTANMFGPFSFEEVRVWAFNRSDLESGATVRNVVIDLNTPTRDGLLPSNMRTAVGAPPAGRPNLLVSESGSQFAFEVFKFHADYSGSGSTFTGPTNVSQASYTGAPGTVTSPANALDSLSERLMMQAQYTNIGGAESVWVNHTVSCCGGSTLAGIQWAQLDVTGGNIATTPVQQQIYPAASGGLHRWMGSLAVDKTGDMALGYSVSNSTTNPDIRYAGRLVGDPLGTLPQTEKSMLAGVTRGTQSGKCGPTKCIRWGDYSAMTIDPDGCRFWYTQEYYETTGLNWQTRVGSFSFPSCGSAKVNQTITFDPLGGKTFGDADFAVSASASSGLTVSFSAAGNCTFGGSTVHITGAGSCTITASQAGDSTYNPAPDVARTFSIAKANQTVNFGTLANKTYGDPDFTVSATASSGLAVSFGASGKCTVSVSTVHVTGAGSCTVTASQAGNSNYNAAAPVSQTFSIAKANQTIAFAALADKTFGNPDFTVSATASSGLAVTFDADGNCALSGSTVHITGAGSCTVTASQAGDANYNAAPDVPRSFSIAKAGQTIAFAALPGKTFGDADFSVAATASSGLAVSFGAGGQCTVTGTTVHITGAGSCTVTASQPGNSEYFAAPDVARTFSIAKANQSIAFGALADKTYGDPDFTVSATASSGLAVSFARSGDCTGSGSTVHITGAGSCTVTASQAGNVNYNAAPDVARTFSIAMANQTIAFGALADKTFGDIDFAVSATASSGLAVTFAAGPNCTVAGATVHITGAGSCTVTASQAGNVNYNAAPDVSRTFSIAKASQTIAFPAIADTVLGAPDINSGATASSGLAVVYGASGPCLIIGSQVHITGVGTCTVTASQPGNVNYLAAADVARSFSIKTGQAITFGALSGKTYGDADFTVSASASSGLPVSFAAGGDCSLSGATVHITGAGSCTVTASQPGNSEYFAAPDVARSFSIAKASQSIELGAIAAHTFGDADFTVSASASSGLAVSLAAAGSCTLSSSTVHIVGAGSCMVTASQPGNANYAAGLDASRTFAIAKASEAISFGTLADKTYGDADFGVTATASSGLAVSFAAGGNCTVAGAIVNLTGAGSCTITASQAGNANYSAAADVARSFTIARPPLTPAASCKVPKVVGKSLAAAKRALKQRHCRVGKVSYAYSSKRKKGTVSSQSRRPGKVLARNAKVNVVVSRGRKP